MLLLEAFFVVIIIIIIIIINYIIFISGLLLSYKRWNRCDVFIRSLIYEEIDGIDATFFTYVCSHQRVPSDELFWHKTSAV